ncbi:MAG TPA: hypothetical protein VI522_04285 [Gammaproteobacteria bacterium]|nr:hypothetical protein [Gammaproteobacteria bacterium]
MIKKMFALLCMVASLTVFADDENNINEVKLEGEVVSIDATAQNFVLKDANNTMNTFQVTPATQFEKKCESCLIMKENILPLGFSDLATGNWVRVKYHANTQVKIASEVKIYEQK